MVTIRRYQDEDLDALKEITVESFRGVSIDERIELAFGRIGGKDWRWRKARHIDEDVAAHREGIFVAVDGNRVVGYITSRIDPESKIGWIPNLAVRADYRGHGLGRRLMETCLDYLRSAGMEYAKIETLTCNEIGSRFYPSVGFREVARQIHYVKPLRDEDSSSGEAST